ncbi:unnamed protein product [Allacma fusca]|uniref:SAM-dependent MTase RsmB/NOP-type domain-containing protein n=1 Tax=Allacma fusca TaxID=39272 RepID=A0A8J2KKV5_9HEXA|nr:unnamed protein product [Allacma fusca]
MGKGRRKPWGKGGKKRAKFEKDGGNVWKSDRGNQKGVRQNYLDIIKENADFEKFYKLQQVCPAEEWEEFMNSLRQSLPTTFRITPTRSEANAMLHILADNLIRDAVMAGKSDSEMEIKAFPLPWYPENFAWQLNLTRKDIRRNESYFRLHNFLVSETESGNISRQEAVSMIPPLALQVEPHHKVLDMCAAPGSKTAQIIEVLQKNENEDSVGMLVANDVDNKRCYMLVHQAKRLQSPAFIITNHDAGGFPDLYCTGKDGSKQKLEFDRILCDVPCSGDGTIRKNIDVWKKWSTSNALALHNTQVQILKRGLELLTIGGYVVYSTCSLNPIENEAVIHRVLKESEGSVKLLDINLPNLKHRQGLTHWTPCSKDLVGYQTPEEVPEKWQTVVKEYMFPPKPEDLTKYPLEKCVRVLAHQQDTGNFFIALLTKTGDLPWLKTSPITEVSPESVVKAPEESANNSSNSQEDSGNLRYNRGFPDKFSRQNAKKLRGFKEDPYIFLMQDDPIWDPIRKFYCLENLKSSNFLTRSVDGKKRNIYFVTNLVKDIITNNESTVKIINTGVKVLARCGQNNKWTASDFRLAQEGLKSMLPYIKGRRVTITQEDLVILLTNEDETKPPLLTAFDPETQVQLEPLERGSCVLVIKSRTDNEGPPFCLELVGWRGATSLRGYVPKQERIHYIRLCGGDISKFETNKFQERAAAELLEQQAAEGLVDEENGNAVANDGEAIMEQDIGAD